MKTGNVLFSAVQFVFAVLVILLGGFFIGLQHASHLRLAIARFFSETTISFSLVGYLILGCGILLLVGFYAMHKGSYYRVDMGKRSLQIDPVVIRTYLDEYWRGVFPGNDLSVEIAFAKGKKLEMFVEFPLLPIEKQKAILEKAETELSQILSKHLGYRKEFSLSVLIK